MREPFAVKALDWRTPQTALVDLERLFSPLANLKIRSGKEKTVPAGPRNGSNIAHQEKPDAGASCTDDESRATVKRDPHSILQAIGKHSKSRLGVRAVLTVLASHVNYHGADAQACFPSQAKIAELANVTIRTVQRAIKKLIELGEVEILEIGTGHRSTRYRLTILNALSKLSPQRRQKRHPNLSPTRGGRKQPRKQRSRPSAQRPSLARRVLMAATGAKAPPPLRAASGAASGYNEPKPDNGIPCDAGRAEKWRGVTLEAIVSARALCPSERWERLTAAARRDGTAAEGVEAEAARRWRADRIKRGEPLGDEVGYAT